jgi:hypothetical protein
MTSIVVTTKCGFIMQGGKRDVYARYKLHKKICPICQTSHFKAGTSCADKDELSRLRKGKPLNKDFLIQSTDKYGCVQQVQTNLKELNEIIKARQENGAIEFQRLKQEAIDNFHPQLHQNQQDQD